jgi:hypothetical protein
MSEYQHSPGHPPGLGADHTGSSSDIRPMLATRTHPTPNYPSASPFRPADQDHSFGIPHSWSAAPNRYTPAVLNTQLQHLNHRPAPPSPPSPPAPPVPINLDSTFNIQDTQFYRHAHSPNSSLITSPRSTLWWGELEAWMDEEYAKQVCGLMGWDPVNVKVPHPAPAATTGQQANNAGYCFLTFPTPAHAASVLAQINAGSGNNLTMPNSNKPFVLNWSSSVPPTTSLPASPTSSATAGGQQQYPMEYSIFVGDLAPETSNSDLVAVFRNPVLGLRNDRAPKFIRPFLSCKSAKIMLDPVTGVSRGYGFVRYDITVLVGPPICLLISCA